MSENLRRIFLQEGGRLRVGWRIAIFFALLPLVTLLFSPLNALLGGGMLADEFVAALAVTLTIWIMRRWIERRPFVDLGLRVDKHAARDLLIGTGIPILLMSLIFAAEWAFGWLSVQGFAWKFAPVSSIVTETLGALLFFILVAWAEELLMRGYLLQTLADGMKMSWAVVITAAFFGLAHLGNPDATWASAAGIFLAGIFLAYGYTRTDSLWLPIGLHFGWNFSEGVLFGFPVSGLSIPRLLHIQVRGPVLWTGGAFGPEAGLIVVPALAVGMALIYYATRTRQDG